MIGFFMTALFVIACLIWCGTWIIQIGAALAVILFRLIVVVVTFTAQAVVVLIGSAGWMIWWCFNHKAAMASLRKAKVMEADARG